MIAEIAGTLLHKAPESIVVDVHGVGYQLFVSLNAYYKLPEAGAPVRVLTHTHVREDALQLYGFLDRDEKTLFLLLIGVSGIGPKLALNILSGRPFQELQEAIEAGDLARLVAIPGVGKKTAERMVVELRDKLKQMPKERESGAAAPAGGTEAEAISALVNLGYKRNEAERAAKAAITGGAGDIEAVIRAALKKLS